MTADPEDELAEAIHDAINTDADPLGLLDIVRGERAERLKNA